MNTKNMVAQIKAETGVDLSFFDSIRSRDSGTLAVKIATLAYNNSAMYGNALDYSSRIVLSVIQKMRYSQGYEKALDIVARAQDSRGKKLTYERVQAGFVARMKEDINDAYVESFVSTLISIEEGRASLYESFNPESVTIAKENAREKVKAWRAKMGKQTRRAFISAMRRPDFLEKVRDDDTGTRRVVRRVMAKIGICFDGIGADDFAYLMQKYWND